MSITIDVDWVLVHTWRESHGESRTDFYAEPIVTPNWWHLTQHDGKTKTLVVNTNLHVTPPNKGLDFNIEQTGYALAKWCRQDQQYNPTHWTKTHTTTAKCYTAGSEYYAYEHPDLTGVLRLQLFSAAGHGEQVVEIIQFWDDQTKPATITTNQVK
jgi:hypothetical protein